MSYGRVEINLLPPELQPGPVVRYAFLINFALVAGVLTFIILDSFLNFTRLAGLRSRINELNGLIASQASVEKDYADLVRIRDTIDKYGMMVGLAAARYADMPVILERISRLLPDGVYLKNVLNDRAPSGEINTNVNVTLYAAVPDTRLIQQTLTAFKRDPIMKNCHLRGAAYDPQSLEEFLKQIGVTWTANGPEIAQSPSSEEYSFDIVVRIEQPLAISGLPVTYDASRFFNEFKITAPQPPAEGAAGTTNVETGTQAIRQGTTATQGMATVDVGKEGQ